MAHEQEERIIEQAIDDGTCEREAHAACSGLIIKRRRLVDQIMMKLGESGAAILCAPPGFGRTAVLLQCVSHAQNDAVRRETHLIDAGRLDTERLVERLGELALRTPSTLRPLVAIDDMPKVDRHGEDAVIDRLNELMRQGYELLLVCTPGNRGLPEALPGACLISSRDLTVQPREYSEWARLYSISRSLDVYELTGGIPSLVTMLQFSTDRSYGGALLEQAICALYRKVLKELRRERDALYRPACMMLLLGGGTVGDFERCGVKIHRETMERLARDYPMFGLDGSRRTFSCLGKGTSEYDDLRREIAERRPTFASRAARMLMKTGRVDAAVALAELVLDEKGTLSLVGQFPVQFALAGHAQFVQRVLSTPERLLGRDMTTGALLGAYASALTLGDYRMARNAAAELRKRPERIVQDVDAQTWGSAVMLADAWGSVSGTALPDLGGADTHEPTGDALLLKEHTEIYRELIGGAGAPAWDRAERLMRAAKCDNEVNIPLLFLQADRCMDAALHGRGVEPHELERLEQGIKVLTARHLVPVAVRIRLAANIARLYDGEPLVDERCFAEAGTMAVRESDLTTQLFCLAAEGWQSLAVGQAINAHFRGQQVLKLADAGQVFLRSWGTMLERTSYLRHTSRIKIREEAEVIDLSQDECGTTEAWAVALHLSAAQFDSELSAWYSRHKDEMRHERFWPTARHAMALMGSRAESLRHLLPREVSQSARSATARSVPSEAAFEVIDGGRIPETGEVVINLFGGFHAERNGHTLTDVLWRRKKSGALAAHLVLAMGSFVSRRTIIDELWPDADYSHGRESLYVTLSSLRAAVKQQAGGPQYVLTQGDGVAFNAEFVYSDVRQFDALARAVLVGSEASSAQQVIETCLKIEQLYRGPLYVPDCGDPTYFVEMRRVFLTKFIDCMVAGIDKALQIENNSCASWLVEAALKQAPTREDVIRRAMTVYDRCGRRREIVELYNGHLHFLQHELQDFPEEETREMYERIINRQQRVAMI